MVAYTGARRGDRAGDAIQWADAAVKCRQMREEPQQQGAGADTRCRMVSLTGRCMLAAGHQGEHWGDLAQERLPVCGEITSNVLRETSCSLPLGHPGAHGGNSKDLRIPVPDTAVVQAEKIGYEKGLSVGRAEAGVHENGDAVLAKARGEAFQRGREACAESIAEYLDHHILWLKTNGHVPEKLFPQLVSMALHVRKWVIG